MSESFGEVSFPLQPHDPYRGAHRQGQPQVPSKTQARDDDTLSTSSSNPDISASKQAVADDKAKLKVVVKECKRLRQDLAAAHTKLEEKHVEVEQLKHQLEEEKRLVADLESQLNMVHSETTDGVILDRIAMLQRDRDMYKEEVARLSAHRNELNESKSVMEESLSAMKQQIEELTARVNESTEVAPTSRSAKQMAEDRLFRSNFSLPGDQYIVCRFPCNYETRQQHGILYIAPSGICFSRSLDSSDKSQNVVINFYEIRSVERTQKHRLSFGSSKCLEFTMSDNSIHVFSGFPRRGTALREICKRAKTLNLGWASGHE